MGLGRVVRFVASDNCKEAQKYLQDLYDDPMTKHSGVGSDVAEEWLRRHVMKCHKCREATTEANMP